MPHALIPDLYLVAPSVLLTVVRNTSPHNKCARTVASAGEPFLRVLQNCDNIPVNSPA